VRGGGFWQKRVRAKNKRVRHKGSQPGGVGEEVVDQPPWPVPVQEAEQCSPARPTGFGPRPFRQTPRRGAAQASPAVSDVAEASSACDVTMSHVGGGGGGQSGAERSGRQASALRLPAFGYLRPTSFASLACPPADLITLRPKLSIFALHYYQ